VKRALIDKIIDKSLCFETVIDNAADITPCQAHLIVRVNV